ncbi:MAG TPA: Verru_Chthon cassette protein D [Candidatus Methylacidiphilales bacterium]|nr:Verru_Chthon cassette protein D [Candidatus Methylacidiphilales bacterium]
MNHISHTQPRRAFTLTELMVVITIMGVLVAFVLPSFTSVSASHQLTAASQAIRGQIALARQTAVTSNRIVQVRFYKVAAYDQGPTSAPSVYRGMQCFVSTDLPRGVAGARLTPLSPVLWLAKPIVLSDNAQASTLLSTTEQPADPDFPLPYYGLNYRYKVFRFSADGKTDLSSTTNCLTAILGNAKIQGGGLPSNFVTLQIDPITGTLREYRP